MRSLAAIPPASFAALLLLAAPSLAAQTILGVRGGASVATLGGSDVGSVDSRTGFVVGATISFPVNELLAVQGGFSYVQKGAQDREADLTLRIATAYVEVPLLLKLAIPSERNLSAHFFLGPSVAFETGCDTELEGGGGKVSWDCDRAELDLKTVDFGAMGGLGVDVAASERVSLTFDLFYTRGLISIDDRGGDLKNRAFSIQVGTAFSLG